MTEELEKLCVKRFEELSFWTYKDETPIDFSSFCAGFKAALKPEHTKHTEEVKGLIKLVETAKFTSSDSHFVRDCEKALKQFEKELDE